MHWIMSPEPEKRQVCVPMVEDLISSPDFINSETPMVWFRQKLLLNQEKIEQVASLTVGQRDNCLWSAVRKYRITASNFGPVLAAIKRNRFPPSLFKRLTSAYHLDKKDAIIWGVSNEAVAVQKYTSLGDAVVQPTGLWLHPSGVLGASPDGLIRVPAAFGFQHQGVANGTQPGVLEVKCPYSARLMTINEAAANLKEFCLEVEEGSTTFALKKDHSYYHQVQGQMYLTNQTRCDFMVWTPKDHVIIRLSRDTEWQENITKLLNFYFEKFIPHIQAM